MSSLPRQCRVVSRASNENARSSPPFARDASLIFECLCASHASPRRGTVCRDASQRAHEFQSFTIWASLLLWYESRWGAD